ncbi:MAG: hypothetical protein ACM3UZ_01435 [Acidobacteriota bacterium]
MTLFTRLHLRRHSARLLVLALILAIPLLLTGCTGKTIVAPGIGDAENALFTNDGRLFVTGGTNIYEITPTAVVAQCYQQNNHCGLAQAGNYIYALRNKVNAGALFQPLPLDQMLKPGGANTVIQQFKCTLSQSILLRAELKPGKLDFQEIYTFPNMFIANGMVTDGQGHLYIADETFAPVGKIVRLTLSANNPPEVTEEKTWAAQSNGISSLNGMAIRDNFIYFTDFNFLTLTTYVKKVEILPSGDPGPVKTIFSRISFFDDLDTGDYKGIRGIAVSDYLRGSIVFLKDNGTRRWIADGETSAGAFQSPSSVHVGQPPMFTNQDLIVTEKGIMFENNSNIGNKVTKVTAP